MIWISCICCLLVTSLVTAEVPYRHKYNPKKAGDGQGLTVVPIPVPAGPRPGPPFPFPIGAPFPPLPGQPFPPPSGPVPPVLTPPCARILQCTAQQVFDERLCRCVCAVQISQCPGGTNYNPNTCRCECNAVCNQFQVLNQEACRCDPIAPGPVPPFNGCPGLLCPAPFRPNFQNCRCECPLTTFLCPGLQRLNPTTCRCECPPQQCPLSTVQDPNTCRCSCRQDFPCPRGQFRDLSTCRCECERRGCPFPQVLNQDTCECECPRRSCPSQQFLNPTNCQCECSNSARSCDASRQRFNPVTCECDCTLVSVTVQVTEPGGPGPLVPGPTPPINPFFFNRVSRTPGGRIRTGPGRNFFPFGTTGLFNGGFTNGFFPSSAGFFNVGKRKRRALQQHKKREKRRTGTGPGTRGNFVLFPPQLQPPPLVPGPTLPPTVRQETRLVPAPCPVGTSLNRASCSCF